MPVCEVIVHSLHWCSSFRVFIFTCDQLSVICGLTLSLSDLHNNSLTRSTVLTDGERRISSFIFPPLLRFRAFLPSKRSHSDVCSSFWPCCTSFIQFFIQLFSSFLIYILLKAFIYDSCTRLTCFLLYCVCFSILFGGRRDILVYIRSF